MSNAGRTFPPEVLTREEILALLDAISKRSSTGMRNRALVGTMYRAGLRVSEALALREKDVDLEANMLRVLQGKGQKFRTVGIDEGAGLLLRIWLERRRQLGFTWKHALFCTLQGNDIDPSYLRHALPRWGHRAGIAKRVHPHGLRHTMTAELAAEGIPINLIRDQLGHGNVATTDKYLRKVAPAALIKTMSSREWSPTAGGKNAEVD